MSRSTVAGLVLLIGASAVLGACTGGGPTPAPATGIRVGDEAPGFTLPSGQGGRASLSEFRNKKAVLLFFSMGPG